MRLLRPFLALVNLAWVTLVVAQAPIDLPFYTFTPSTYVNSTGLTDLVQWDGYSLFVKGQRIYVYSGEIHSKSSLFRSNLSSHIPCILGSSLS